MIPATLTVILVMYIFYRVMRHKIAADYEFAHRLASRRWLNAYVSFFEWSERIVPPLLLIPLFRTPWEVFLFVYWIIGFIACAYSIRTLIRLWTGIKSGPTADRVKRSVRPVLTTSIFVLAAGSMWYYSGVLRTEADALGRTTAKTMLSRCTERLECPEKPQGWMRKGDRYCKQIDFMNVCYSRNPDLSSFTVTVTHRLDDYLRFTGGVSAPLKETSVCC